MEDLFFELIRVSLGLQARLTRVPSSREWNKLYLMAEKQSLGGICFAGLQQLGGNADDGFANIGMSEMQYLDWMSIAAIIQQTNEDVNRQCAELQSKLASDGYRACILKGQGVAQLYSENIRDLRQSGDIDIWVEGEMENTISWIRETGAPIEHIDVNHAPISYFKDTVVEIHFIPNLLCNPFCNKRIQQYFASVSSKQFDNFDSSVGFSYPTVEFNLVYSLLHIYHHQFGSGIGLRQIMDYYFISKGASDRDRKRAMDVISSAKMKKFAGAMMYVMKVVFDLDEDDLICEPIQKEGSRLLNEIMISGNFGFGDKRFKYKSTDNRFYNGWIYLKKNLRNIFVYPHEVIWSPFWKLWHYCWRKRKGYL